MQESLGSLTKALLWGWGIWGMPVNFFSGFFGIKLQCK
jgi:hypothetical protein